jgi:hypothetical protein
MGRDHDNSHQRIGFLDDREQGETVLVRQAHIQDHGVKVLLSHSGERLPSGGDGLHQIALMLQEILEGMTDVRFIVHNE